ncbi:PRTRC system protein A [Rugamonas sp. A1-17]|nr:PRTRC system protein A [Rugamonas sp. A1-17]
MDKRDVALHATLPSVAVPRFGPLELPLQPCDRILIASNGVFIESFRRWGHFIRQVGSLGPVVVPYGVCQPTTTLTSGKLPRELLHAFNAHADKTPDVEVGGSIIWNENTKQYRLALSKSLASSGSHLKQEVANLDAGEHLVIDCHSHAHHHAFFSAQDDQDDRGATKFAYVVGNCNRPTQSTAMRLCVKGVFESFGPGQT